ncbi:glycosyl transferase family protein [Sphingopyxis panaciterrae]
MELSTAGLEWLVHGAGHELMLFAAVGILLIGLDDLLFDALWLATRREPPRGRSATSWLDGTIAIFVPAWHEAEVLPATLRRALAAWDGEDFRLYIGCYPNDAETLFAVSPLIARDPRLRLVIGEGDGPTTKGDNLNRLWAALGDDERAEGRRFAAIVLHDAEDHVHREELALYRRYLGDYAMVQIPVVPIVDRGPQWVSGHYGDEFAEAHGKELVLRSRLGMPIPSAGVGCALTRNALALLALDRGGEPFRADSLTEDYEVGMLLARYGLGARFVDARSLAGGRVVSRGSFPEAIEAAVKQKARWITGIALAGWEHLGWLGRAPTETPDRRAWLLRWMLWRDRRAPLTAIILLAAYVALILSAIGWAGQPLFGWQAAPTDATMQLLLGLNAMLLLWRLGMRGYFTARCYGWRQGLLSFPRAFVANVIAMLAARRAIACYCQMLRSGRVIWEKTDHREAEREAAPVRAR